MLAAICSKRSTTGSERDISIILFLSGASAYRNIRCKPEKRYIINATETLCMFSIEFQPECLLFLD